MRLGKGEMKMFKKIGKYLLSAALVLTSVFTITSNPPWKNAKSIALIIDMSGKHVSSMPAGFFWSSIFRMNVDTTVQTDNIATTPV